MKGIGTLVDSLKDVDHGLCGLSKGVQNKMPIFLTVKGIF